MTLVVYVLLDPRGETSGLPGLFLAFAKCFAA